MTDRLTITRLTFDQTGGAIVAAGWATQADLDALYALVDDPGYAWVSPTVMAVRGRRH